MNGDDARDLELDEASNPRMLSVLARLRRGGAINVGYLGGSITTGYAAETPEVAGWAALTDRWWQAKAAESGGSVRHFNLGLSGTDSALAACRVGKHVVENRLDLVVVEFSINDQWLDPAVRRRSYEGMLRQILSAPGGIAVLLLFLCQKGRTDESDSSGEEEIGRHYGLPMVRAGDLFAAEAARGVSSWDEVFTGSEVIHPNGRGHAAIARFMTGYLDAAWARLPRDAELPAISPVPTPLHSDEFEFTRVFGNTELLPVQNSGWETGSEVHPEWPARGGAVSGWTTRADGALLEFRVTGRIVGVFYAESETYRNAEAWVDGDEANAVTLECFVPTRVGYLGWAYRLVADNLSPGEHLLRVRTRADGFRGSDRNANLVAVMTAGLRGIAVDEAWKGRFRLVQPSDEGLVPVGRIDRTAPNAPVFIWQGTEVRARISGGRIGARFSDSWGGTCFNLVVDGRATVLKLVDNGIHDYILDLVLPEGEHEVSLFKRTEAYSTRATFLGLIVETNAAVLPRPPERRLLIEFFGDSITAGACNEDPGEDQYDDVSTHDNYLAYGAITARNLGADYLCTAVSGVGISYSWNPRLLPRIYDRLYPEPTSPRYDFSGRKPDIVVINVGQNDYGFPLSIGKPFPIDFRDRYVRFVHDIRGLYPEAFIVCAIGGMTAYRESAELRAAFDGAVAGLKAEDGRILSYCFRAASRNHPRVAIHRKLAGELTAFLLASLPDLCSR